MSGRGSSPALFWALALLFGFGAVFAVRQSLRAAEAGRPVLVAVEEVAPFSPIPAGAVRVESRPARGLPVDVLSSPEEVRGQYARTGLVPGEVLQRSMLASASSGTPYDAHLTRASQDGSLRAVPLAFDAAHGYALVRPGDRVDLVGVLATSSGKAAVTLARDVLVLDKIDEAKGSGGGLGGTATPAQATSGVAVLALTPAEAQVAAYAAAGGSLTMVLAPLGPHAPAGDLRPVTADPQTWGVAAQGGGGK